MWDDGWRREVDAHSVIARDLLRERLTRLQAISLAVKRIREGKGKATTIDQMKEWKNQWE